jgi:pentatricopeptide repeat protein
METEAATVPTSAVPTMATEAPTMATVEPVTAEVPFTFAAEERPTADHADAAAPDTDQTDSPAAVSAPLQFTYDAAPSAEPAKPRARPVPEARVSAPVPTPEQVEAAPAPQQPQQTTAEQWAAVREHELALQRVQQEREDADRVAAERREVALQQQDRWVASRPQPEPRQPTTPHYALLREVSTAKSWYDCLKAFGAWAPTLSHKDTEAFDAATGHVWRAAAEAPLEHHEAAVTNLSHLMKQRRSPSTHLVTALRLAFHRRLNNNTAYRREFSTVPLGEKARLPSWLLTYGVRSTVNAEGGSWVAGCELLRDLRPLVHDPYLKLELALCRGLRFSQMSREARQEAGEVVARVEQSLTAKLSEVGKAHILALMQAYGGTGRVHDVRRLHDEVQQRGDGEMDESISGMLLRYSATPTIKMMIPKLRSEGLNVYSIPIVLGALNAMLSRNEADTALEVYASYREKVSVDEMPPSIAYAALRILQDQPSRSLLDDALAVVRRTYGAQVPVTTRSLLYPVMADFELFEEIAAMEASYPRLQLSDPRILSLIAEDALAASHRALGLAPIERATRDALPVSMEALSSAVEPTVRIAPRVPTERAEPSATLPSTAAMLEYGKERNWEAALGVIEGLEHPFPPSHRAAVVLLYNCALSAAVGEAGVAQSLLADMQQHAVLPNTTTYNTLMSSYARDEDRWGEALSLFGSMDAEVRDVSSYSVALSVFARRGMWLESTTLFDELRRDRATKPSPVLYGLAIQASHKANWVATLRLFREMHKAHGAENVKELIVTRVVKALEAANRSGEASRVLDMMRDSDKKKKKKQK